MRSSFILAFVLALIMGCGTAPVQWRGPPREPPRHNFIGAHGIPRAYNGGVCLVETPHSHNFPPVPRAAYTFEDGFALDTRKTYPFFGSHPHVEGTCFLDGWHLHLEPAPRGSVVFDTGRAAFVATPSQP